jgi:hypothetical protein
MNRDPMDSFNKPFQSGDGLCYPIHAKNYYKTQTTPMFGGRKNKKNQKSQKGGNDDIENYSQPSNVTDYPGNAYLSNSNQRNALTGSGVPQPMNPLTEKFLSNNMGITYATQAGGRKKKYKGGFDLESPGAFNQFSDNLGSAQGENSGSINRANGQRAGKYKKYNKKGGNMSDMPPMPQPSLATGMSAMPKPSIGVTAMPPQPGTVMPPNMQPSNIAMTPNMQPSNIAPAMPQLSTQPPSSLQATVDIMSGGRYKKYSKKGGYIPTPDSTFSSKPAEIATQTNLQDQAQHIPKGGFAMKELSGVDAQMAASEPVMVDIMSGGRKKSSRKLKGGVSDFATTLSSRGPINYPDALSAQRFRYFNKTGTYIPNTMLQYAAAPISTGYEADSNPYPMAYNDYIGGSAKKKAPKKKTTAASKKKAAPSKKKAAPAKKKAAPAKKKSASSKKKSTSAKKK